ncbi:MAG: Dual-specificity RNA pseudouridine synthase RluF [Chlamydiales bacterium]|nr:Dual-specificity RNA pseudouridine synthase RluF [Chlamydiales bacterium]
MHVRLSKLLSERGICSRREADRYIEAGMVLVDGEIMSILGSKVSVNAEIELMPEASKNQKSKVTILLNKPVGFVSTQPEKNYRPAIDLITPSNQVRGGTFFPHHLHKLSVVGRLDIDSKGLLVLTQDGVLAKCLIGPDSEIEKEYLVRVEGILTPDLLNEIRAGLYLDGKQLKSVEVDILEPQLLRMILREGKKRQIRRMCEMLGLHVVYLKRVRIGEVRLGDLPEGKWRYLKSSESFI